MSDKQNHWSNYWEGGSLTSLPQDFLENYDGEIAEFWVKAFSKLAPKSHVLDLCTGNGAIALLAAEYSRKTQKQLKITGLDAAKVNKDTIAKKYEHLEKLLNSVEIIDECRIENNQLASSSFELITSQYGIEYCDWTCTAEQVYRLLKLDGHFVYVSHAYSTAISEYMQQEEKEYDLLAKWGMFSSISDYYQEKSSYHATIKKLVRVKKHVLKITQSNLIKGITDFLEHITSITKPNFDKIDDKIQLHCKQHLYAYQRLKDVVGVSNKIKENPEWYLIFEDKGLNLLEQGEIIQSGNHNAGKYYIFNKVS